MVCIIILNLRWVIGVLIIKTPSQNRFIANNYNINNQIIKQNYVFSNNGLGSPIKLNYLHEKYI